MFKKKKILIRIFHQSLIMRKLSKKSFSSERNPPSQNLTSTEHNSNSICQSKFEERWCKNNTSSLIQKREPLKEADRQVLKLTEAKNVLVSKLKAKDEEVCILNEKVSLLLREISTLKTAHLKALEEAEMLKIKLHEYVRKNEMAEQKMSLYEEMRRELIKSPQSLTGENLKNKCLETLEVNPQRWRTMQCTDPHYLGTLKKKDYLQKDLMKMIESMLAKDVELDQKNSFLKNLKCILERRPHNLMKDPIDQILEFYKAIQLQKEKIKIRASQVDMFESAFSDKHHKFP